MIPPWKFPTSSFSFGACAFSSGSPTPKSTDGRPSTSWNVDTTGIEPPSRVNTGDLLKPFSIARLAACDDPNRRPVLVHCARGTCRTGAAVALYRYERDGWTIEDVAAEMARQTYRPGWLPGYVFGMVSDRPQLETYDPSFLRDYNATAPEAARDR